MLSFSYMTAHAPPGLSSSIKFANEKCSWLSEMQKFNLFGCFEPRFVSEWSTPDKREWAGMTQCSGPLIKQLFDEDKGHDEWLDFGEAKSMAATIRKRLHHVCGDVGNGPAATVHTCFAHATFDDRIDRSQVADFAGCLVGHERAACQAEICT